MTTQKTKTDATRNRELLLSWLKKINATPEETAECVKQCVTDDAARRYYLIMASD